MTQAVNPSIGDGMDRSAHWEKVYREKRPDEVSWFQAEAGLSREVIERLVPDRNAKIVDVGAGGSTLVDFLLASRYRQVTVADLSAAALTVAQERLGDAANGVSWCRADVLTESFMAAGFDCWHDRAVFHFLVDADDRAAYVAQVRHSVRPGGLVIVATFAEDGPTRCSGLEVARYSPRQLQEEFGEGFAPVESHRELHRTPGGSEQAFTYVVLRVVDARSESRERAI